MACAIFLVAGLLAHEHRGRVRVSLTEHASASPACRVPLLICTVIPMTMRMLLHLHRAESTP
jgi:hypothetical protein